MYAALTFVAARRALGEGGALWYLDGLADDGS